MEKRKLFSLDFAFTNVWKTDNGHSYFHGQVHSDDDADADDDLFWWRSRCRMKNLAEARDNPDRKSLLLLRRLSVQALVKH
jgi:hypothetical protein